METFSALLALCEGNPLVTGEFPSPRPVTHRFDVNFDMCLKKKTRFSKQSWRWWYETQSCSLWRHCNAENIEAFIYMLFFLTATDNHYSVGITITITPRVQKYFTNDSYPFIYWYFVNINIFFFYHFSALIWPVIENDECRFAENWTCCRDHSVYALERWLLILCVAVIKQRHGSIFSCITSNTMMTSSNVISHWLGACAKWSLIMLMLRSPDVFFLDPVLQRPRTTFLWNRTCVHGSGLFSCTC